MGKARCELSKSWLNWPAAVTALKLYYLTHLQYIISLPFSFLHKRVGVPLLIVLIKFMMPNDCSALCLIVPLRDSVRSCPAIRALHSARWGVARLSYDETWCMTSLIGSEALNHRKNGRLQYNASTDSGRLALPCLKGFNSQLVWTIQVFGFGSSCFWQTSMQASNCLKCSLLGTCFSS